MKAILIISATALLVGSSLVLHAAQSHSEVKRTHLVRQDLDAAGREVIQVRVDFPHGVAFPQHSHPGVEVAYVIEGVLEYQFKGQPPVTLKAGDSLFIPAGTIHSARNIGDGNASELATYIIEKGKPLLKLDEPAPAN
jgi:quercetin dioxygenase-like cupin family protein